MKIRCTSTAPARLEHWLTVKGLQSDRLYNFPYVFHINFGHIIPTIPLIMKESSLPPPPPPLWPGWLWDRTGWQFLTYLSMTLGYMQNQPVLASPSPHTHTPLIYKNYKESPPPPPPTHFVYKLELVYLPVGKYCVYPRMVYRQAVA